MRTRLLFLLALLISASQLSSQQPVDFEKDIQPILAANCLSCHQGNAAPAELRLDSQAGVLRGGMSGQVIVSGNAEQSLLVQRISSTDVSTHMPPGGALTTGQIALVKAWINQGAKMPAAVDFGADVLPILSASCFECHAGNAPKAGLRLDVKSRAFTGGISGPVILAGNSKDSRLIHRVTGAGGERQMPLEKTPLPAEKIAVLARWIDQGANWPDALSNETNAKVSEHWAYARPVRPTLSAVNDGAWLRNPIDNFILARLEREGLHPSREASRETLVRRLSLDLTGVPPTPAEVDEFLNDARPDAYEQLVDRLLSSPRYGERWAVPWLDLARYAESDGGTSDGDGRRLNAWPYRDWVIKAFNQNMPFDQFTIEQIAGDMLPNATSDQKVATGFSRQTPSLMDNDGQLEKASAVATTWLASTVACAQCHNHKYDPFTQKDFYQMVAFFNNNKDAQITLPNPDQSAEFNKLDAQLKKAQDELNNWPDAQNLQAAWERETLRAEEDWKPLIPTRLVSTDGATLTAATDGSILASGLNPDKDTYILEARAPVSGTITGIRVEALTHPSLPAGGQRNNGTSGGGPGRDYYGNFMVQRVDVEVGSSLQQLSKVVFQPPVTDEALTFADAAASNRLTQLWRADPARDIGQRVRRQLLLLPDQPLQVGADGVFRVTINQVSEFAGTNLGHFRVSVTTSTNPKQVVEMPHNLRPALAMASADRTKDQVQQFTAQWRKVGKELEPARQKIAGLQSQIEALGIPTARVLAEQATFTRPATNVRIRGNAAAPGEEVFANVPAFLGSLPSDAMPNRLGLAKWLISSENPLTARVRMNQIWQTYFGRGIVETSEDFGTQGTPPSHPELLDWLAVEFMARGWDQKAMHRLIVTSSTYRQSSEMTPETISRDPQNVLLARGPRFRVEAEMVRDIAMAASGLLSSKMYGPPVMPPQPAGLWTFPGNNDDDAWVESKGEDRYRRGIYTFIRRTVRYPSLTIFDAPNRAFCIARRTHTNTPLQALVTLNDPGYVEAAQAMARRIVQEGGTDKSSRAIYGFRLATSRKPGVVEMKWLVEAFDKNLQEFNRDTAEATAWTGRPDPELAAWTVVSNALLNLNETLTKE